MDARNVIATSRLLHFVDPILRTLEAAYQVWLNNASRIYRRLRMKSGVIANLASYTEHSSQLFSPADDRNSHRIRNVRVMRALENQGLDLIL